MEASLAQTDPALMAAIATTRFGLGARPGEIAQALPDPKAWLKAQITAGPGPQPTGDLAPSSERLASYRGFVQDRNAAKRAQAQAAQAQAAQGQADQTQLQRAMSAAQASGVQEEAIARARLAATTDRPFAERWALFWANHFTVSAVKAQSAALAGPFEREAIRPHVFGQFTDLVLASSKHPGMLTYLDQVQSTGPNSQAARRRTNAPRGAPGLNENLAREIMELHTVGVHAGYSQDDVTEFARAMTGWSIGAQAEGPDRFGKFVFRPQAHEPGARTVLGKRYPASGEDQAEAIIRDLAAHPGTARHVAGKLATHFVSDAPPPELVARLEQTFTATGGDLAKVAEALIDADESWAPQAEKFKTPYELLVSSYRAAGGAPARPAQIIQTLNELGQATFRAPSPKGWPDDALTWAAPDAVLKRLTWAEDFAGQNTRDRREPIAVANDCLGARLSEDAQVAIVGAESRQEALTVLIMSPEFQRR